MKIPQVTIVIATFNSEKTLSMVLNSIKKQSYPQSNMEILLVDGGSTDSTLKIGRLSKCKIIDNPKTQPVHAKYLGYLKARGKYIIYLDHDEIINNKESIKNKIIASQDNPKIPVIVGSGYQPPKNYSFITLYINEFGDPFSFFIYRLTKDSRYFIKTLRKRYKISKENDMYTIFDLSKIKSLPIIEVAAGGTMIDKEYFQKKFPKTLKDEKLLPHFFYFYLKNNKQLLVMNNDSLVHYSSDTLHNYLNKIKWRIKNNIFHINEIGEAGYLGRVSFENNLNRYKKYLFIFYAIVFLLPIIDSLVLSISRKNLKYFYHFFLTEYTAVLILSYFSLKLIGYKPKLKSYDEKKEIAI